MRIGIDMSSVIWTCLLVGTDKEGFKVEFEGEKVQVNSAAYGYENAVNSIMASMKLCGGQPKDLVLVVEGLNSKSRRLACDPGYKSKRGKRPPEAYAEFGKVKDMLTTVFGKVGALVVEQEEAEADDVLAFLAENSEEDFFIVSRDNDLFTAFRARNKYGASIHVLNDGNFNEHPYGNFPHHLIPVYKALVGDSSDSITGIPGFGKKAFEDYFAQFGADGMQKLYDMGMSGTLNELVPLMDTPIIAKIMRGEADFLRSFICACLHPEWVNTVRYPLQFRPGLIRGEIDDERFEDYKATSDLITLNEWDAFKAIFMQLLAVSSEVGFDIETSTPDDSDDWLQAQGNPESVDVIGSKLTGCSFTLGANLQHTFYISVDHADTANVTEAHVGELLLACQNAGVKLIIHNFSFEGTVLYEPYKELLKDNGNWGMLNHVYDTKLEASYVNENEKLGLKFLSLHYFGYQQVDYKTVTTVDGVQKKMNELTGQHVMSYGCDDTICCSSLHNFFKFFMQIEHTWQVYLEVEIDSMYQHTMNYIQGFKCDVAKAKELEAIDQTTAQGATQILHAYLINNKWEGSLPPAFNSADDLTPAKIKEAYTIVTGRTLETAVRMLSKLIDAVEEAGEKLFAAALTAAGNGDFTVINSLIQQKFVANPVFNPGSPKQMNGLLYETMGLPVRVYNKPTPVMRAKGIKQGNAKADELAISYAMMMDASDEQKKVLDALRLIKMVETREGLYYSTYPYFVHWKTGRIHSSHNQCATNTRRASSSAPNMQQMPKHQKIEGQPARFREVMVPHKKNAVIVSMDFAAQELRVIADYSRDPNMVACFVGENLKDMHMLTGAGIAAKKQPDYGWTYEGAMAVLHNTEHECYGFIKKCRSTGKVVNFSTEYGAMAPKVAVTLLCSEADAQAYIDAREDAFPVVLEWKDAVIHEARAVGFVKTKLGAVRHLRDAFMSNDMYERSKAERQAVNTKVQGSCAEMTKLAEGRMWRAGLVHRFDAQIIGPIHDEVVASVAIEDLHEFIPAMHACMVAPYADMWIPIESSISFGCSFGEQIEVGSVPSKEAIDKGLAELAKLTAEA